MELIEQYESQSECDYKDEHYLVRDNGSVLRKPKEGKRPRPLDDKWTFGTKDNATGYMTLSGHRVHIIVATAFHGPHDSKRYVVDHIDTNRCNNRKENLRWLTKLENILLNPITKAKIEYICGSVDNFLKNPSLLNGHDSDDPNFGWMRTVSKEEAANTLENWHRLFSNPRPKPASSGPIGDWIYREQPFQKTPAMIEPVERMKGDLAETRKIEEKERKEAQARHRKEVAEARKRATQEKISNITEILISLANEQGWIIKKKQKGVNWKADLFVETGSEKIAVRIENPGRSPGDEWDAMKQAGIRGLWLGGVSGYYDDKEMPPFFDVETVDSTCQVPLHDEVSVPLKDFFLAFVSNTLIQQETVTASAIKVRFVPETCYKCGAEHYFYFVLGCYEGDNFYANSEIDLFDPSVIRCIEKYICEHPEFGYRMGQIRDRHSNTMNQSYMSFGCPECDALVGDHYVNDAIMDLIYEKDDMYVHRIELEQPITISTKHWVIK